MVPTVSTSGAQNAVQPAAAAPDTWRAVRHVLGHLLTPLLMCVGMGLAYLSAFHAPAPHEVKVAVAGSSPQTMLLAQGIKDKAGDALDVTTAPSADVIRQELLDRTLVAGYLPDPKTPELLVASGNSDTSAMLAEKVFTQVAAQHGQLLKVTDLAPTGSGDPTGQGLFFLLVAVSIGSYASVAALGAAGAALHLGVRALLGLGVSVVVSLIGIGLAGPVFGVLDHGHAGVWALAWLYSAGIVAIGTALHTFLGRWTTLATMLLFVMLNFTSSGGIYRPELQNGFFAALHGFWNGAAFVEGSRDLLYFDARAGFGTAVLTLALWLAAGVVLLLVAGLAEHRRARSTALAAPAATPEPVTAGGPLLTEAQWRALAARRGQLSAEEEIAEVVGV